LIRTDVGWIYPEIKEEYFFNIAFEKEIIISSNEGKSADDPIFASFTLRVNNLQQIFDRKYDKIQDVVSNLGKRISKNNKENLIKKIYRWYA
jgi:hypothetical protein